MPKAAVPCIQDNSSPSLSVSEGQAPQRRQDEETRLASPSRCGVLTTRLPSSYPTLSWTFVIGLEFNILFFDALLAPLQGQDSNNLNLTFMFLSHIEKETWSQLLSLVPRFKGSRIALPVETSNADQPHERFIYNDAR